MKKSIFLALLLLFPLANALSYCNYNLNPILLFNNTTYNLTWQGNGTYIINISNQTVEFRLTCNQNPIEIQPQQLNLVFENQTQKDFYLVLIPKMNINNLSVSCLNCNYFNITNYNNLQLNQPKTLYFNLSQHAPAGNYSLILQFSTPLFIQNYKINVEIKPKKQIEFLCPNQTTQYYNYPLLFYCQIKNKGNVGMQTTLSYLDKSQTLSLEPFQTKKVEIFKELSMAKQIELKQLNINLSYENKTITQQVNITWKDASKPQILAIDYNQTVYYGQSQNILVKAYDDSKIEKIYAIIGNETLTLSKLPNAYLLAYTFKKLGQIPINITACDTTSCVSQQITVQVKKIPIQYQPKIILPQIKKGKSYEITLLKAPEIVEYAKVNMSLPDYVSFNVFPLTNWKTIKATLISNNLTQTTINLNFSLPNYTEPQNISMQIIFTTGMEEITLPKGLQVMGSNITCKLANPSDPFSNRICEIIYPSFTEQNFIPIPLSLVQQMQAQQEELPKLKSLNLIYTYFIVALLIGIIILFLLWLKETDFFERIRT